MSKPGGQNGDPSHGQGLTPEQVAHYELYKLLLDIAAGELVPPNAIVYKHDEPGGVTFYSPLSLQHISIRTLTGELPEPDGGTLSGRLFVGNGELRTEPEAEWFCEQPLTILAYKLRGGDVVPINQQGVSQAVYDELSALVDKYRGYLAECF